MRLPAPSSRSFLALGAAFALAAFATPAALAQPANDLVTGAIDLTLDQPVDGTTVAATHNYFDGALTIGDGLDVVYRFVPPFAGDFVVRLVPAAQTAPSPIDWSLFVLDSAPTPTAGPHDIAPLLHRDTQGLNPVRADRTTIRSEEAQFVAVSTSTPLFVVVDSGPLDPGGDFTLVVLRLREEAEPNNTVKQAETLRNGAVGEAEVTVPDFFFLGNGSAGDRVFALVDAAAANNTAFEMRVTTDSLTLEYDSSDGANHHIGNSAPVIAGAPVSGTGPGPFPVYARVNHFVEPTRPYRMYGIVRPAGNLAQAETGGAHATIGTAQALDATGYQRGQIAATSEVDVYEVQAHAAGDSIFIALDCAVASATTGARNGASGDVDLDARLELLDSSGAVLVSVDGNFTNNATITAAPSGVTATPPLASDAPAEGIAYHAKDSTPLYVRISAVSSASFDTGAYLLSVAVNGNQPQVYVDGVVPLLSVTRTGTVSASAAVTVTGRTLGASSVTVRTTSDQFEIAKSSGGAFGTAPIVLVPTNGRVDERILVRYAPTATAAGHTGAITAEVTGGVTDSASVEGIQTFFGTTAAPRRSGGGGCVAAAPGAADPRAALPLASGLAALFALGRARGRRRAVVAS